MNGGVCDFTSHNNEKWEAVLNAGWCERLHHIRIRLARLYSMQDGVWLYITSQFEVWDYTQWRMVCEFTSHNNEKCETILNEGWCVSLHHITMRSVRPYSMKGGVWVDITKQWEVWDYTLDCLVADRKDGCMNVAWGLCWKESRTTTPCVFLCRVAAAGDERYLVCVRRVRLRLRSNRFLLCVLQRVIVVHVCVILCVCWLSGCRSQWNGCMNVPGGLCWGESRSTKPCVFPCKVAAAGDERYLVCAAGAAAVVSMSNRFLLCVLQRVVVHVCVILSVCWLSACRSQWNGCMAVARSLCWGESRSTKPGVFPCKVAAAGDKKVPRVCGGCGCGRLTVELVPPLCSATSW